MRKALSILAVTLTLLVTGSIHAASITTQSWDGVTAPAIPAGWSVDSGLATSTASSLDGTNALIYSQADSVIRTAYYSTAQDGNSGNVVVSHFCKFDNLGTATNINLFARGNSPPTPWSAATYYELDFSGGTGAGIKKHVAGTDSNLAANVGSFSAGVWYFCRLTITGGATPTLVGEVQRCTDGAWLNSSGTWVTTGRVAFASVTDASSPITGQGYAGIVFFRSGGAPSGNLYSDHFSFSTSTADPASGLFLYPEFTSGYANHRAIALTVKTNAGGSFTTPITLSDGGAGGQFVGSDFKTISGGIVTLTNAAPAQVVWYIPPFGQTGTVSLSGSSGGVLADTLATSTAILRNYPTLTTPDPTTLNFDHVISVRPTNLWSALPSDVLGGITSLGSFTKVLDTNGGVETLGGGNYSRLNASQANEVWYDYNTALPNPGYNAELQIVSWGGGATDQAKVGVYKDVNNWVACIADHNAGTVTLVTDIAGVSTTRATATISLAANSKILFQVLKKWVAAWYKQPSDTDYQLVGVYQIDASFNFRSTTVLATFKPFFGTNQATNTAVTVTGFQLGHAGGLGFQNPRFVRDLDTGAPLLSPDNKSIYLTSNSGGVSNVSTGVDGAWMVDVWKLNTYTYMLTQVSRLWFIRGTTIASDLPTSIAYDSTAKQWVMVSSNWDDYTTNGNSVDLYYCQTAANVLSGVQYLTNTALPVPNSVASGSGSPLSHYDADLIRVGGNSYRMVYAETSTRNAGGSYYPAYASASTLGGTWTQTWQDSATALNFDSTTVSQVGGTMYVTAGETSAPQVKAFNVADGSILGNCNNATDFGSSTTFVSGTTIAPHLPIIALPSETAGQTRYLGISFDGIGYTPAGPGGGSAEKWNWGNLLVFEATQRRTSSEFTWTNIPTTPTGSNHLGIDLGIGLSAVLPPRVPFANSDVIGRMGYTSRSTPKSAPAVTN